MFKPMDESAQVIKQLTENGYSLPKKVGVIYSEVKREYFPTEALYITEKDAFEEAKIISEYISKLGIESNIYPGDDTLIAKLQKDRPDMVFNLVDSVKGVDSLSSAIPGILEMLEIPYTGGDILGLALCFNKFLTKELFLSAGVPVPHFQLFNNPNDVLDPSLRYPLISKLNEIHGAVEITQDAVSENEKHLRERLKFLMNTYKQSVIVEEFIVGKEITAYVLEGQNRKTYLAEKIFNKPGEKYVFATFDNQWVDSEENRMSYKYEKTEDNQLKEYVRKAFDIAKMRDYAKFDIRVDISGRYYFIDSNCNPAFGPKELGTALGYIVEDIYGISFPEILKRLIINTMKGHVVDYTS